MKKNVLTTVLLVAVLALLGWQQRGVAWNAERIAGAVISLTGAALVIAARIQLGSAFSVRAKATRLVTTGLYSRIRNPIYVFAMLVVVGLAMYIRQLWILVFVPILIPAQVKRSRNEAQVLHEAFGEEYERYRRQTWF